MDKDIEIIVRTEQQKVELLEASRHIHDNRSIDTDVPGVNLLAHLHCNPDLIHVTPAEDNESPSGKFNLYRVGTRYHIDGRVTFASDEVTYRLILNGKEIASGNIVESNGLRIIHPIELKEPIGDDWILCVLRTYSSEGERLAQHNLEPCARYLFVVPGGLASIDTRVQLTEEEKSFEVWVNGTLFGHGRTAKDFNKNNTTNAFSPAAEITTNTHITECVMKTFDLCGSFCRKIPLTLQFVPVIHVPK